MAFQSKCHLHKRGKTTCRIFGKMEGMRKKRGGGGRKAPASAATAGVIGCRAPEQKRGDITGDNPTHAVGGAFTKRKQCQKAQRVDQNLLSGPKEKKGRDSARATWGSGVGDVLLLHTKAGNPMTPVASDPSERALLSWGWACCRCSRPGFASGQTASGSGRGGRPAQTRTRRTPSGCPCQAGQSWPGT